MVRQPAKRDPEAEGRSRRAGVGKVCTMVCVVLAAACDTAVRSGESAVEIVVDRLEAAPAGSTTYTTVLESDVLTSGTPHADLGRIVLRARLRDPGSSDAPTAPSAMNVATLTRYRVAFRRSDGRGVEGRDVPYAFDGSVTVTVDESATPIGFTLVRPQAKLEPPLRTLVGRGGASVLSTFADVSFYGRDARGRTVAATASMTVHFADWEEP
ncbi:MAG: hypothetical protein GEU99_18215 [Luteitalea sp.]|nr:hypothetical protein [Luteitalea sp.]